MAKSGRPRSTIGLRALSRSELIEHCRQLYESAGISVLTFDQLRRAKLYYVLYAEGITIADLVRELRIEAQYQEFLASRPLGGKRQHHVRWTWNQMVAMAKGMAEKEVICRQRPGSKPTAMDRSYLLYMQPTELGVISVTQ